jgi:hypothetical protein
MVYEAELAGLLLGLHLSQKQGKGTKQVAIGIDNQAVLKVFYSDLRNPEQHLVREALCMVNITQKCRGKTKGKIALH